MAISFSVSGTTMSPDYITQYPLGKQLEKTMPPKAFWRTQFYMPRSQFVKYNFTLPEDAIIGSFCGFHILFELPKGIKCTLQVFLN